MATLSALDDAPVWLNSEPLTAEGLRGRVVLVDVWTYSCVNWLRTLPYVAAWHERYGDRGLVVVGVHAPEFGFEHDLENVRRATDELGVRYPVVIDNDFTIWRSLDNHYWPAVYLVDGDGSVRFRHFGEGAYEETERAIQRLLRVDEEAAALGAGGGSIGYRFEARDLNLVLAPATSGEPVRFSVRLDGQPPGDAHGVDVDAAGDGIVSEPRMYQLVRRRTGAEQRTFEITFLDPGVRAYVFTFG